MAWRHTCSLKGSPGHVAALTQPLPRTTVLWLSGHSLDVAQSSSVQQQPNPRTPPGPRPQPCPGTDPQAVLAPDAGTAQAPCARGWNIPPQGSGRMGETMAQSHVTASGIGDLLLGSA